MTNNTNNHDNLHSIINAENNDTKLNNDTTTSKQSPNDKEAVWLVLVQDDCFGQPFTTFNCTHCGTVFSKQHEWITYYHYCSSCGYHMRRSDWDDIDRAIKAREKGE